MKKMIISLLVLCNLSAVQADEKDPFEHCYKAPGQVSQLNCKINVVNDFIENEFGTEELENASELAKEDCKPGPSSHKLSPKLRLLVGLDCELRFKIKFYNGKLK